MLDMLLIRQNQSYIYFFEHMNHKKELEAKSVHRFTDNAAMKFRPIYYKTQAQHQQSENSSMVSKVSQILGNFFGNSNKKNSNANSQISKNKTFSKSSIAEPVENKNKSFIEPRKNIPSKNVSVIEDGQEQTEIRTLSKMQTHEDWKIQGDNTLLYLQKITIDTFLIGNQNQLDLITISGIYDNAIDTDLNWSLNLRKKISKLAVDNRKCLLSLQCDDEILVYRYDSKRLKTEPTYVNKVKLFGLPKFLLFLKDSQFGVFYKTSACIYQVEENNTIRLIFNKKYGVADNLALFQIPKPIENLLNIFFIEKSQNSKTYILWRLQLQFKAITPNHNFKSIARIYNIPSGLVDKFKIDNFSKEVIILNFKFEILAAKDGFIIDTANTNIQEDGSCLVYQGQNLLHISENKLFIYSFKILTNVKPNKIELKSTDSIDIKKDSHYSFFDCLQMLNGNFVLFFQVKPEHNNKLKGQIDYAVTVTQKLSIQEKLNEIFSFKDPQELKNLTLNNFQIIQQKCDMAFKIGLSRKQVYFELWNKSNKKQIPDYKFLLDTMDYETIKYEIQKKLKKSSMPFNEVYKIEQACFEMLRSDLFSNLVCTEKCIKNYLISHYLLRKLIYFKNTNLNNPNNMKNATIINERGQEENIKMFMIDIQQYVQTSKFQLQSHFLEYVTNICNDAKDTEVEKFRIFMREFRFPLRIIYPQLLEVLIIQAKKKLINFLKIIPQILPFQYPLDQSMADYSLYQGLWSKIEKQQWLKNLHIQEISTIYNRNNVEELTKAVWFKRNQNTLHDLVALSKQKIISVQQFNASDNIFYFFIEKIFQYVKDESLLNQVVDFLQINYVNLPPHLKGKIFLYKKLFDYFVAEKYSNTNISSFNHFLKLKDHDLFKELFNYEKVKKVCLLEDAKNIYEAIPNGIQMYYQGLLNYFASDLSEISDLKYILNRLNNKKREFHIQNQGIYAVLVRAMQMKLKLGSQNDIPLDQVMIYVENIPLSKNNPVIEDLKTLERINQESERFKKMKLNMSLLDIIENCEDVITALVNQQIRQKHIIQMTDENELIQTSYNILAQVQTIKDKIYKGKYSDLPYFIYLSKLLQVQEMIKYVSLLLNDKYLLQYYCVDDRLIQNLVLYMYKWKFNQDPVFVNNKQYIQQLLTLLHEESECRKYIESQIQFAIMLTTQTFQIQYPLTESDTISIEQISNIIENHSSEDIKKLDLHRLHEVIKQMQELCVQMQLTSVQELYQICIKRLINLNNIREAIPMIRQLIRLYGDQQHYSIVFCFMILSTILLEMLQVHRKGMIKIVFYTFDHPTELLEIIEKRLNSKLSNDEQQAFLANELDNVRKYKCFNKDNLLLDQEVLSKVTENEQKYYYKLQDLIFQTWNHLNSNREDFQRNYEYSFYYIMLLHNPYSIAKFISANYKHINIRIFRSYMSYVFREDIFNGLNVLHFGKRIFLIVLESVTSLLSVEVIASQYRGNDFSQDQLPLQIEEVDPSDAFLTKIHKSIKTFKLKIMSLKNSGKIQQMSKKKKRIDALMSSQASIHDNEVSEYPFNDSDDNYEELQDEKIMQEFKPKKKGERHFDPNKERKMIMSRQGKNLALYLSSTGENQLKRTSPKALKASKTFQHAYFSVNFSKGGGVKPRKSSDKIKKCQLDMIERSDSIGIKDDDDMIVRDDQLVISHNQDEFFSTAHPILMRPLSTEDNFMVKTYSPQKRMDESLSQKSSDSPYRSPAQLLSKQSVINVEGVEDDEQTYQFGFRVNIQEIDDESYSPVETVRKHLLQDVISETDFTFDLSPLAKEEQKQAGDFADYLKSLIECIYEERGVALSVLLQLIKLLKISYSELKISSQFLDFYIALQNYNLKYRSDFLIREMFPISGIFLDSKDPIVLFQYVKNCILDIASYDRIVVIAQLLTTVLRKHDIKDDLYLSFLAREIELYGNDVSSSVLELKMQKERIEGILPQITTSTLFLQRGQAILRPIASRDRRQEAAEMIKQALRKKKKDILIRQFEKKIACLNI